jgi:hypothetical protein
MVNLFKSTADSMTLLAVSDFYRGVATLEILDLTKVRASGVGFTVAPEERSKVDGATGNFRKAQEHLALAAEICSRSQAGRPDSLDCDLASIKHLNEIMARVAVPRTAPLPALEDVQAAMRAIDEGMASWHKRAEALRGTPGHYPAGATSHP